MGWESLAAWGPRVERGERLTGGAANDVWTVRLGDRLAVGRLGRRSDDDLAWETDLLVHLDAAGLTVPTPIPTPDGRGFVDGLTITPWVDGGSPRSDTDWRRVADTLREVHRVTEGWPQRPGWRSSHDLLTVDTGTKVDLTAMPAEGVVRCRAAWARLEGVPHHVVHGDLNPGNIRLTADGVGLIDWDEARVDLAQLDLVLPGDAGDLGAEYDTACQASAAWEAAVCWDDDYSKRRLAEVRPI